MAFLEEPTWRGKVYSGGWKTAAGGEAAVTEPATGAELTSDVMRGLDLARRIPTGIVHINDQTVDDAPNTPFGGVFASGAGARFGGTANLDAFTDTRWVTMRADIAPYPF
jgi:acyl-CoA reductase-like NAD-dependent aldehyde dehydrogenase